MVCVAGKPEETRVVHELASGQDDLRMRRLPRRQPGAVPDEFRERAPRASVGSAQRRFPNS